MDLIEPASAYWVGLDRKNDEGGWQPIDLEQLGGEWWVRETHDPLEIARRLGPGFYRARWSKKDRRYKLGASPPFEVTPPAEDAPGTPDAVEDAAPEAPAPAAAKRRPAAAAAAIPPPVALTPQGFPMVPLPADLSPLATVVYLDSLNEQKYCRLHAMTMAAMQMMMQASEQRAQESIANEHRRSHELVTQLRVHHETVVAQLGAAHAAATAPRPTEQQMVQAINKLAGRVDELTLAREGEEDGPNGELARLSANPNDTERVIAGVQNIVGAVLNSPIGPALAEALKRKLGFPEAMPTGAAGLLDPAAE